MITIKNYKKLIKPENLQHAHDEEENLMLILQKLYDWQEEYDYVPWEEFRDYWTKCDRCDGYEKGSCICYAR